MNQSIVNFTKTVLAVTLLSLSAEAARSAHNVDFLRKMANPTAYRVNKAFYSNYTESICGTNLLQHVEEYDGSRGQPVEFVAKHEQAVAAMAYGTPENSKKYCTGTMISEDLFLTASHCIDGTALNDFVVFNYQKARGTTNLQQQVHVKIVEVVEQSAGGLDYAILRLEGTPGATYGFTPINTVDVLDGHLLTIIQHPKGQPKMVDVGRKNGTRQTVYMTYGDLDTEPGSSGSGILNDVGMIVGVHTNGGCSPFSETGANAGVMMTEIVKNSKTIQTITGWAPAPVEPPTPVDPAPVAPAPAPADPAPVAPAPAPVDPAPVAPAPAPVDPAPVAPAPAPVDPAPVAPAPADPGFIDPGLNI